MKINLNMTLFSHVTLREKVFLARQLAVMLSSGLPVDQAFKILANQTKNSYLVSIYQTIVHDLEQGSSLSGAIAKYPKIFDPVFIAIVRSGEGSGQLDKVLIQLADRMEVNQDFQSKVTTALIYPIFILITMIGIIAAMMVWVIPNIKSVFEQSNIDLPWTTKTVIAISDFTVKYWWIELIAIVVLSISGFFFFRTENGGSIWDLWKIRLPIVRDIFVQVYMGRFCQTMAMLTQSGVPIMETMAITANVIQNRIYTKSLKNISAQVERGIPMSVPMQRDRYFPTIVSAMVAVGEQTGKLEMVLTKLSEYYERETNAIIKGISGLIEPVIILIIGLGVGFLVYSIIMPIYSVAQTGF